MTEVAWIEDRDEVCAFAHLLVNEGMLESAHDVVYFFEKPWKWTDEHGRWVTAGRPATFDFEADALRKLDALLDEDMTAESPTKGEP